MRAVAAAAALAALLASAAAAQEPPPAAPEPPSAGDTQAFTFRTTLKTSVLFSREPDAPILFPDRTTNVLFWRARFEPTWRAGAGLTASVAYEQRVQLYDQPPVFLGGGILPSESNTPYRIRPLEWVVTSGENGIWLHGIDRAFVAWHLQSADITVGRQAIGWGRGIVFGATDIFAPFSPLEADREWRSGVDAVRVEVPLAERVSIDGVAAFSSRYDEAAFAGRVRGYAGRADLEIVGGRRGRDAFGGVSSSAAVGKAEVHGELALFRADEEWATEAPHAVAKALVGGSYQFPLGPGLFTAIEYHYSGFGSNAGALNARLTDPIFLKRLLRGDVQVLTRHALAVLASSELSPELTLGGEWLHSPVDGSGVLIPSVAVTFSDRTSTIVNAYLSYGRRPYGTTIPSEYGASGLALFVQFRAYF